MQPKHDHRRRWTDNANTGAEGDYKSPHKQHSGNSSASFDPAESEEAACEPAEIPDTTEDVLKDLIHPEKLSPKSIDKLTKFIHQNHNITNDPISPQAKQRIRQIIHHLRPTRTELINRWAFAIATEDPSIIGITGQDVARILGINKSTMSYCLKKWRKVLGYDNSANTKSQGMHLRGRTLRQRRESATA